MAKLLDGTRIYGTANVDTRINVGSNVFVNTSTLSIGNSTINTTANSTVVIVNGTDTLATQKRSIAMSLVFGR